MPSILRNHAKPSAFSGAIAAVASILASTACRLARLFSSHASISRSRVCNAAIAAKSGVAFNVVAKIPKLFDDALPLFVCQPGRTKLHEILQCLGQFVPSFDGSDATITGLK
jgi:hypothetical protein